MSDAVAEENWPAPRENPDFVGHTGAEAVLLDAYYSHRLPHAWLICGPRGIGKATLAYRFARFVLARKPGMVEGAGGLFGESLAPARPETLELAPGDPVFRRVAGGGHADLRTVERSSDKKTGKLRSVIVVDDVRGIGDFLSLTPAEGGWRVVIIDAADDMNRNAANAVLKVLEEPPPRALLLLVSHNPGRLLPTIRSRCRRLVLKALSEEAVGALLARYCPELSETDRDDLGWLAEGSIGRGLTMAGIGGVEIYRDLLGLLETLPQLDVAALHRIGDRVGKPGADEAFRTLADLLRLWLSRLILFGARTDAGNDTGLAPRERALMQRLTGAGDLDRWLQVWEKINDLLARSDGANMDRKQMALNVFLAFENAARA
jgi:DNA polymerase-3 subunit delta'